MDLFSQPARNALDAAEVLDGRRLDAIEAAKLRLAVECLTEALTRYPGRTVGADSVRVAAN